MKNKLQSVFILCTVSCSGCRNHFNWQNVCIYSLIFIGILIVWTLFLFFRSIVEEAMQCKKKILQNDGIVTSSCARPRKAGHTLLILGGQTFMCDKIYQVTDTVLNTWMTCFLVWQNIVGRDVLKKVLGGGAGAKDKKKGSQPTHKFSILIIERKGSGYMHTHHRWEALLNSTPRLSCLLQSWDTLW